MCVLEKLNFKISRGCIPPDPPSVLAPSAFDPLSRGGTPIRDLTGVLVVTFRG